MSDATPCCTAAAELTALRDSTVRLAADFSNYKKRNLSRIQQETDVAVGTVVESLLPVLDALDEAARFDAIGASEARTLLLAALERHGLTVVRCDGGVYDPNVAEAFVIGNGDAVGRTLRAGYLWRGKLLRAALVEIGTPEVS